MNRKAMQQMLAAGKAGLERQEKAAALELKRKARQDWLNEPVTCFMCGKSVPRKSTFLLPDGLGPACKSHPGVSS
jgi:hypothetical protein